MTHPRQCRAFNFGQIALPQTIRVILYKQLEPGDNTIARGFKASATIRNIKMCIPTISSFDARCCKIVSV